MLGGIAFDMLKNKQSALAVCNLITSISMLGIPWSRNIGTLTGLMVISGASAGSVCTCGNVFCLNLWGKDSGPFYQALHFTFGIGCLLAPLIAASFIGDYTEESSILGFNYTLSDESFPNFTTLNQNITTELNFPAMSTPPVTYPFTIIGCYGFIVSILLFAILFVSSNNSSDQGEKHNKTRERSLAFISLLVVLCGLLLFVETGTEIGFAQMLTTYAAKGTLKLTTTTGSYMTSAFWAAFTISRLASVFLATKFSNLTLLAYDLGITSVGAILLLTLSNHEWILWLSSVLIGIGIASFFPATLAWLDSYINVTNKIASLLVLGGAFGEMLIPFTISTFIESVPEVLVYVVAASCFFSSMIVLIMYLILRKTENKYVDEPPTNTDNSTSVAA
ncbi:sodium-dependent glucose transporter 1-like [Uloborus diversus]|uniref:sodium-dependent glucose transporter 1-like n=1 Tax=Uloborus diversus TaxID=327109 RepID=UPI00240A4086|nr:sodium-dependent glucose transporter 1-like [Uloborus diversus]